MPNSMSPLDANQVIRTSGANVSDSDSALGGGINVISLGGTLVPEKYNQIDLTYVAAGNGVGEIETATYYLDAVQVALLTLTYDAQNRITSVVRS